MGDTLDETPAPSRRDKPHSLNIGHEEEPAPGRGTTPKASAAASIAIPAARCTRNRMRHSERDQKRDHSSDGLVTCDNRREEFAGLEAQPRRESLNSCEAGSPVALSTSLGKAGRLPGSRYPSGAGATAVGGSLGVSVLGSGVLGGPTTRKCVLTLDGYSYVIVASTPESLPSKRDESGVGSCTAGGSGSGSSGAIPGSGAASGLAGTGSGPGSGPGAGTAVGGAGAATTPGQEAASPTVTELCGSGPNATINGQVARHGSLTIIRRTNSRNFTQIDSQLASPSATVSSTTATGASPFAQTPISEPLADRLGFRSGSNGSAASAGNQVSFPGPGASASASATATATAKMQPSSPNTTNYMPDNVASSSVTLSQSEMKSGRESGENMTANQSMTGTRLNSCTREHMSEVADSSRHSFESPSNQSFTTGQWETESLPAVDTPDALNKAAGRIRSLLRRMDHEAVPYEDMQRNLHYAARVLEAVFIDESRSPTSGKTKLGQIASSSVESEDEGCNSNCKNLSCSRHSHGRDDQQQDNNNSNSSCSLQKAEEKSGDEVPAAEEGDNQAGDQIESRTKGVSLAPQTHSGPTGPPAAAPPSAAVDTGTANSAAKLQPALETVQESVMEDSSAKDAAGKAPPTPTPPAATSTTTATSSAAAGSVVASSCSSNPAAVRRQRNQRTPTWARSMSTNKTTHVKENHGASIFGVSFNTLLGKEEPQVFATAGSNRVTVYECPRQGGLQLLHCYADPDPDEVFYTCAWSYDLKTSAPLLAAAGYRGVIRVIDIEQNEAVGNYIGHGQAINELKFHPHKLQLLLSGSKDHAIRLWNIQTHVCIAILGGVEGHRDEVLSIDFNMRGDRIVSSGMDHSLKLWCLNTQEFQHKIELSNTFSQEKSTLPFPTVTKHFPDFSTRDIHRNYVDCVQWFGNFVLSKSCENAIVCWKPGQLHQSFEQVKPSDSSCTIIAEFEYDECEIWFVRFGFNPWQKVLALGNQQGKVYVWELDPSDPDGAHMTTLQNLRSVSTVRQIAFSRDASVLVYVCDDATVWRWNRRQTSAI